MIYLLIPLVFIYLILLKVLQKFKDKVRDRNDIQLRYENRQFIMERAHKLLSDPKIIEHLMSNRGPVELLRSSNATLKKDKHGQYSLSRE